MWTKWKVIIETKTAMYETLEWVVHPLLYKEVWQRFEYL